MSVGEGISIVMSTYQRAQYLRRSMLCYAFNALEVVKAEGVPVEFIVVDDGSTDDTAEVCRCFSQNGLDIKRIHLEKTPGLWRDCAATINIGLRAARGELIIATHPEVMPGRDTVNWMWHNRADGVYLAAKVYYLTPADQDQIDTLPILSQGAGCVNTLPGFYDEPSTEHQQLSDYSHAATDRHTVWQSWVYGAMTKQTWRDFGGMRESDAWGTVDMDFNNRRLVLGIRNHTAMPQTTIVVHQNHDRPAGLEVATPRDMAKAFANMPQEAYTAANSRLHHL